MIANDRRLSQDCINRSRFDHKHPKELCFHIIAKDCERSQKKVINLSRPRNLLNIRTIMIFRSHGRKLLKVIRLGSSFYSCL